MFWVKAQQGERRDTGTIPTAFLGSRPTCRVPGAENHPRRCSRQPDDSFFQRQCDLFAFTFAPQVQSIQPRPGMGSRDKAITSTRQAAFLVTLPFILLHRKGLQNFTCT